jgi:hypothetical protein
MMFFVVPFDCLIWGKKSYGFHDPSISFFPLFQYLQLLCAAAPVVVRKSADNPSSTASARYGLIVPLAADCCFLFYGD